MTSIEAYVVGVVIGVAVWHLAIKPLVMRLIARTIVDRW
jgi:hypothetical protein